MRCFALFVLLCATSAAAQEIDRLQAARDFGFEGLKLSTPLAEFQRKYPNAQLNSSGCDKAANVIEFIAQGKGASSHGAAIAAFCDGKLYTLQIIYLEEQLRKVGGDSVPFAKLAERFGPVSVPVTQNEKGTFAVWEFPEVNRRITCAAAITGGCGVTATDTQIEAEVQRRKTKAADLGF